MYVFVTLSELTGNERHQHLGRIEDDVTLRDLLAQCLGRVDRHLPERDRGDARHFWYNDAFVPFENRYLRDVAEAANVTLELRPDYYRVRIPRRQPTRYAIDPERSVAQVLDELMEQKGASCCYDLVSLAGRPLDARRSLWEQEVLPFHARLSQQETELIVRRKPSVWVSAAAWLAASAAMGLGIGYLLARLGV
jgi:hypothetical protein